MANQTKLNVHGPQSDYPMVRQLVTRQGSEVLGSEEKTLDSMADFETLLEEVKQFNTDPQNKDKGITQIIC